MKEGRPFPIRLFVWSVVLVAVAAAGVYRVEGWLKVDGEERPWIYSNPIYAR